MGVTDRRTDRLRSAGAVVLTVLLLGLTVAFFLIKKTDFSEGENRYLTKLPAFSFDALKNGTYTEGLQSYLADHFPLRDRFMELRTEAEIAAGNREVSGVYIADDGYLIEDYAAPKNTEKAVTQFHKFYETLCWEGREVHLMLVPTSSAVCRDLLPPFAPVRDQLADRADILARAGVPSIDCYNYLVEAKASGQVFYRTDHHWTTYGAYAGYLAWCEAKEISPVPLSHFTGREVTQEFRGTVYSKLNDDRLAKDAITIYEAPDWKLHVRYTDTGEESDSLYNLDYVEKKDKYSLFLNNIHPLVEITNEAADSGRELALVKDSYANSMVPFLVGHYRKIYVFDTRYYKKGPSSFIREHPEITDVLILYNMNTLDSDAGIGGIY